jgi:hypothetical protein
MADKVFSIVRSLGDARALLQDAQRRIDSAPLSQMTLDLDRRLGAEAERLLVQADDLKGVDAAVDAVEGHLGRMTAALHEGDVRGLLDHGIALVGSLPGDPQTDP